jgi:protein SCO1
MSYYECPLLCPLVLNGTVDAARRVDGWVPGQQYEVVAVSIDPDETPAIAAKRKEETLKRLAMPGAEAGWHFLTGTFQHVDALAAATGFGYRYIPAQDEYAHGAVLIFVSPEGMITRYLPGTTYPPEQFKLALLDAGEGKVGSLFDQFVLWCFQFDETKGKYTIVAMRVMQLGGLAVLLTLSGLIGFLFVLERKRRRAAEG